MMEKPRAGWCVKKKKKEEEEEDIKRKRRPAERREGKDGEDCWGGVGEVRK